MSFARVLPSQISADLTFSYTCILPMPVSKRCFSDQAVLQKNDYVNEDVPLLCRSCHRTSISPAGIPVLIP